LTAPAACSFFPEHRTTRIQRLAGDLNEKRSFALAPHQRRGGVHDEGSTTMFGYQTDFDRSFYLLEQLGRKLDRVFHDIDRGGDPDQESYPRANLYDNGKSFVLSVELPGLTERDFELKLAQDVLTLSGEHKPASFEGYAVHRRERRPLKFSRSFALPAKVDAEKISATLENGVLSVTLDKAPEVQPRTISVRSN
jgi:HSP20 family protein